MNFHWFDVAALVFLAVCVLYSAFKGFIKELFSVFAWIAGYFGSIWLHPLAAPMVKNLVKAPLLADLLTFFLLFTFIYIGVRLLGTVAQKILGLGKIPSEINRGAGAIMGAAKWVFFLAIFLYPLGLFPDVQKSVRENSVIAKEIMDVTYQISSNAGDLPKAMQNLKKQAGKISGKMSEKAVNALKGEVAKQISGKAPAGTKPGGTPAKTGADGASETQREEMDQFIKSFE
jgi:uncharacterized membrane protein required for colicin V production